MYQQAFSDGDKAAQFVQPESILCAGHYSGGRDACVGDSGGPLAVCDDNTKMNLNTILNHCEPNRWKLVGIISIGYKCAEPRIPGLYTNISIYTDWIRRIVVQNSVKNNKEIN